MNRTYFNYLFGLLAVMLGLAVLSLLLPETRSQSSGEKPIETEPAGEVHPPDDSPAEKKGDLRGSPVESFAKERPVTVISQPAPSRGAEGTAELTFADITASALGRFVHVTPIVKGDSAPLISGAASGDFNNDGWEDLYVIGGGLAADALYINMQDGTFIDMAEKAGLGEPHLGSGAAVGDYNGDGWLDNVGRGLGSTLYVNQGDHRFEESAADVGLADGGWGWGTDIVDLNHDTLPDVIAVNG